jgi:hypothetical protein
MKGGPDLEVEPMQSAPSDESAETVLMLGRDCTEYGGEQVGRLGRTAACLSAGCKGCEGEPQTNEDALLLMKQGDRYLLAVADGHYGLEVSHQMLQRLSKQPIPTSEAALRALLTEIQNPPIQSGGGTTLTVGCLHAETLLGFGLSTGDSTLAVVANQGLKVCTTPNHRYLYPNRPLEAHEWCAFDFSVPSRGTVLLFTDGVNECHYRRPETSVQEEDIERLWLAYGDDAPCFASALVQLSLMGVRGNPGGQDNVAVAVFNDRPPGPDLG